MLFSLVSNLSLMDDEKLAFLVDHGVQVCTSLDGPEALHNYNRKWSDGNAHAATVEWMKRLNEGYVARGLDPDLYREQTFFETVGCEECGGTGFLGRTAVSELLDMSNRIRQLILERRPSSEIKQVAREEGMTFLRDSALEKVFAGVTTLREINKVTFVQ